MSGSSSEYDGRSRDELAANTGTPPELLLLDCVVVNYENGPDRATISPRELPAEDRLTTWLSANADAFVALDETR